MHYTVQTSIIFITAGGVVTENKTGVRRVSRITDCVLLK